MNSNFLIHRVVLAVLSTTLFCSTQLLAGPPDPPKGFKWVAVEELTDEFDGDSLDASKWYDYHPNWDGRAPSQFKKGNAFVENNQLLLRSTLKKDPNTVDDKFKDIWVNSAACVSKERSAKPGYYYEARFKASSLSMTSSFWFRVGDYSEIDVIEHIGDPSNDKRDADLPYEYHVNTHYYGKHKGIKRLGKGWQMPTRGRDEFHTYGLMWHADGKKLEFYHNNEKVMEVIPRVPLTENLKMIFDTEVFPFATAGVAKIGLPLPEKLNDNSKNTMYVDWVRTYKLAESDN
ncbi:family 16 glycosylhydrolase [Labilibacter marinus]|uniref:family 16 glycosylhydrolase n=1 Tax=Labilibacter marinus TaxID=1477105 RepID=UPI00094F49FA|nr:family 16 glycosylhydrolase [Labilibacter marinus]